MGVGGSNNISNEKYINEAPIPVSMENTEKIIKQMKNCVCKIHKENKMGTGFFTKIPYNSNILPVLITNNHILDRDDIKCGNTITISLNNQKEFINIKIDESRKVFTDDNLDVTIIEIREEKDKITNFLELDDKINQKKKSLNNVYASPNSNSLYIIHYPKGENIVVSYGILLRIDNEIIHHKCNTETGLSGSPIISLNTFKVVGIHSGNTHKNFNKGIFIKYAINKLNNEDNEESNSSNNSIRNDKKEDNEESNIITINKSKKDDKKEDNYQKKITYFNTDNFLLLNGTVDYKAIPNDLLLCTKCNRIPEVLNIHSDNGHMELRCKIHGVYNIDIGVYLHNINVRDFKYFNEEKCCNCDKFQESEDNLFKYCNKCKINFCEKCRENHKKHSKICIPFNDLINKQCKLHFNQLEFFCEDCEENICENCIKEECHSEHEIKKLIKYIDEFKIDYYKNIIENKNKQLSDIIIFNRILLNSNKKFPKNYYYTKSIFNIGRSIEREAYPKEPKNILYKNFDAIDQLFKDFNININGNEEELLLFNKNLNNEGFKLLTQIHFRNLNKINVSNNKINNVKALILMNLSHLEELDLSFNEIENIDYISEIEAKRLKDIYLQNNKIKDLSPFLESDFPELEILRVDNNTIDWNNQNNKKILNEYSEKIIYKSITIEQFKREYDTNFKKGNNRFINNNNDTEPINDLTNVKQLYIFETKRSKRDNLLKDFYLLIPQENKICELRLFNANLKNVSILSKFPLYRLKSLDLSRNNITNVKFLKKVNFNKLKFLYLTHNKIYDISPLINYKIIKTLGVLSLNKNPLNFNDETTRSLILKLSKNCVIDIINGHYEEENFEED